MCGFEIHTVHSSSNGDIDINHLEELMDDTVSALTLTIPNTLGLFDPNIIEIGNIVHDRGALLIGDGANLNAIIGKVKFGDLGIDCVQLNLHKTFSTPHGGGGPGAGPVSVNSKLVDFLPSPLVTKTEIGYTLFEPKRSVGSMGAAYGNFNVMVKAYAYIRSLGAEGLKAVSENAVLNANYLKEKLKREYYLPYDRTCMHEVVFSSKWQRAHGVHTIDIAKRLLDYGFHPPTVYFPLIVDEAMMIEPTETESWATLDAYVNAMIQIAKEAETNPEILHSAPRNTPIRRLDEAAAARKPNLRWVLSEEITEN
jgi:glycine dehydrogenase subunit 2